MSHQLLDSHLVIGRFSQHLAVGIGFRENLHTGKFRNVFGYGVTELKFALIMENHQRGAGDRFSHRKNAENGIHAHWHFIFHVLKAEGLAHLKLTILGNH